LNVQKKKKQSKKGKNSGADGIRFQDLWSKNPLPYQLRYGGLAASV
jgi:hypothetical protein